MKVVYFDLHFGERVPETRWPLRAQLLLYMEAVTFEHLSKKLLHVLFLLTGLFVLQLLLPYTLSFVPLDNLRTMLLRNSRWIGNSIFGLAIFGLVRKRGLAALSVGMLAIVLPAFGSIFYVLLTIPVGNNNESQ
jgi:hypothetical protein